jgi:hypothetical protein
MIEAHHEILWRILLEVHGGDGRSTEGAEPRLRIRFPPLQQVFPCPALLVFENDPTPFRGRLLAGVNVHVKADGVVPLGILTTLELRDRVPLFTFTLTMKIVVSTLLFLSPRRMLCCQSVNLPDDRGEVLRLSGHGSTYTKALELSAITFFSFAPSMSPHVAEMSLRVASRYKAEKQASLRIARVVARFLEAKGTPRGWERRKEQDQRAEVNIPLEHQLLWRKLKPQFKGTPDERAEQFMEYIEEHPGESEAWLQQHADKELAKATREWEKKQKLEKECDKGQTKYEEAWKKEQDRATKEQGKLKQLKQKADATCQACPTCEVHRDRGDAYEGPDEVPFA